MTSSVDQILNSIHLAIVLLFLVLAGQAYGAATRTATAEAGAAFLVLTAIFGGGGILFFWLLVS